ncbi:MAG: hypothetical protein N2441_11090 [Rhodocyclaceae bacterium]|nr:hypothetical protein [Rhodocyclaceae bacterium]
MRSVLFISASLLVSACASQPTAPAAPAAPAPAPAASAPSAEKKAPQCWNGDVGQFQGVGTKATIAGVAVECKATADGKNAFWVGVKP